MGTKMRRPCSKKGCRHLSIVGESYCQEHIHLKKEYIKKNRGVYDRDYRDKSRATFYKSFHWKKVRAMVLDRDNHLCQVCKSQGRLTFAKTVHHIQELSTKEGWDRRLDMSNLVSVCHECHNAIHKSKHRYGE